MVLRLCRTLQLPAMLIPASSQIGLCLFCASPAVNKDVLGIIAMFKGGLVLEFCFLFPGPPAAPPHRRPRGRAWCGGVGWRTRPWGQAALTCSGSPCPPPPGILPCFLEDEMLWGTINLLGHGWEG